MEAPQDVGPLAFLLWVRTLSKRAKMASELVNHWKGGPSLTADGSLHIPKYHGVSSMDS